ncbi:bifunctional phosphopantothenoylcysteine decarboxylase/phosphopantothenate--cysteine ligase CoaBC [Protaetiibacter sp. SSC-01]|uniref:bifunctional phosphopantothenoylcysteine decarboxylase/phosphopantothenate--cysteine ligase CoaBC n=1 Tax=Protaetiibacter sp. SSC-01 TaxID=2759943 RepID=UPI001656C2D4|nr:bifunctional phosphopantothenoylcysteine decarboxylase/phosphopantothenate--cysteine ligase CoaBC [Protaetiibacter sp. SSC-01]QNO36377.1 bifunctional phosphopantothenoylcysteine decarboxylase/phosphopantothenate--cysteine ligase CoaBC [Protaetiibacter sp. SSC-01]
MSVPLRVVVGISGGIAAYKAVGVAREFVLRGHDVHVVATEAALRFVGRPTLEAISRNPVETELFEGVAEVRHVALGQSADLVVVAPATANTIAKLAAGLSDDLLGTTILASTAPLVVAPAMHTEMWQNAATRDNIATLRRRGVHVVGPASGQLTGSDSGPGRMAEPVDIVEAALAALRPRDLVGRRVVVSAGGTREPLDPVRFLGNRSSGRQGVAIAEAARDRGAHVVLVAAHLEVPPPSGIDVRSVGTAEELRAAVLTAAEGADAVVMAAAVADYRPENVSDAKIKKEQQGDELALRLVRNPDILAELSSAPVDGRTVIGFAAETETDDEALLELGRAKIARKGCDYLVVNRVGWSEGFATEGNAVVIVSRGGDIVTRADGTKREVADAILDLLG